MAAYERRAGSWAGTDSSTRPLCARSPRRRATSSVGPFTGMADLVPACVTRAFRSCASGDAVRRRSRRAPEVFRVRMKRSDCCSWRPPAHSDAGRDGRWRVVRSASRRVAVASGGVEHGGRRASSAGARREWSDRRRSTSTPWPPARPRARRGGSGSSRRPARRASTMPRAPSDFHSESTEGRGRRRADERGAAGTGRRRGGVRRPSPTGRAGRTVTRRPVGVHRGGTACLVNRRHADRGHGSRRRCARFVPGRSRPRATVAVEALVGARRRGHAELSTTSRRGRARVALTAPPEARPTTARLPGPG